MAHNSNTSNVPLDNHCTSGCSGNALSAFLILSHSIKKKGQDFKKLHFLLLYQGYPWIRLCVCVCACLCVSEHGVLNYTINSSAVC